MVRPGRLTFLGAAIYVFALVLVGRLYQVQAVEGERFAAEADRQYIKPGALFDRGSIFFSDKSGALVSAATLATGYTIALEPSHMDHPEDVFNALSGLVTIQDDKLLEKVQTDKSYVEVARRVDEKTAQRVEALDLSGVGTYRERWRTYPAGPLAANALGFVGFGEDGTTLSGRYGLEKYYDATLSRDSSGLYVNFFAKVFADLGGGSDGQGDQAGDIVTTIEPTVQAELEKKLSGVVAAWHSDLTGGIVMDPYTGEIFAMAVTPSFDPNEFQKAKDSSVYGNPLVDRVYEMGSIVKPLAMAAGIDAGAVTPKTTYDDKGFVTVNGAKVSNFDGRGRGVIDMQRVLNESLNTGMAFVVQKLGNDRLTSYYKAYGFGTETGIDLPGEARGLIQNLESSRDIEHVTAAFGQGVAFTPIQTIRALSALGNGGVLPNPHLVKEVRLASGEIKTPSYDDVRRVISPESSETITRMLVTVVDQALLNGTVKMPRYTIAAKTGTAQIPSPQGGYYPDRYLHSFFGYFPAFKPRFIIFLFTVYPKGAEYASHTLTMPFIDLAKFLINYYDVPPDR
jgi:cell division protein FtsI/penicillin-binding protein 2